MAPVGKQFLRMLMLTEVYGHFGQAFKRHHTSHETIMVDHQKAEHRVVRKVNADIGYALGVGYCLNIDTQNNATVDFLGDHDCATLCRGYTDFACHGYSSGAGVCKLYASNALQAQRAALVTTHEHTQGVKCYVLKPTYSADFPLIAISSTDFLGCYDGSVTALGLGEVQVTSNLDYVHLRDGDAHGFYAGFCARQCQSFRYFLMKSHVAADGRGSNKCFCVERLDRDKNIDRFVGNSYFGTKLINAMCPPWNCVRDAAGCVWQAAWDKHVAIYRTPTPNDGEACPDHQSSQGHQSNFVYLSGSSGRLTSGWYRKVSVAAPSACAEQCFIDGPSVRGHIDSLYNETCHGYYVHRDRQLDDSPYSDASFEDFQCYLYNNPIPHTDIANYHTYDSSERASGLWNNYLCVLRTCIEDTPCAWNMAENFRRVQGFRFTSNSTRVLLPTAGVKHCDQCADACSLEQTCAAYQCSISINHCYLFADAHVDVDVQVSDVSLCVKSSKTPECSYQNGAKPVLSSEAPCRCGGEVCATGDYCTVDLVVGSQCVNACPCVYSTDSPTDADKVCSTKNVTFESECALRCANETLQYAGSCSAAFCPSSVNGTVVVTEPCLCQKNATDSTLCPVGSLCYSSGNCSQTCEDLIAEGETVVCGSDGKEYPSRCVLPAGVTVERTGPCPMTACGSGQTDCACHNETCVPGPPTTTQCALDCVSPDTLSNSCGCVAPCENLQSKNDVSTAKADLCGCATTSDGYVVCDGHCFVNATGNTTCLKTCPSPGECVCGASVCESTVCDTTASPPVCRPYCSNADDTDCTCQGSNSTDFCTNGTRCLPLLSTTNETDICVPECAGLAADNSTCYCHGDGSDVQVCYPPATYCSVTSGGSGGKCVKQQCENGETDCFCGVEACISATDDGATYCDRASGKCYLNCVEDGIQTNCFCPNAEAWNLTSNNNTNLCVSNPDDLNSVQNTYCTPTTNGSECVNHCKGVNGTAMQDSEACPCGVGVLCTAEEDCLHIDDALSGQCLKVFINESCYNITNNPEEHIGNAAVSRVCNCGGMPCAEGSFCDSMTGTCSPTRISECSTIEPATCAPAPCRCGSDIDYHVVCSKNELCMASFSGNVLCVKPVDRCHDYPQGTAQSSLGNLYGVVASELQGLNSECYCGSSASAGMCAASQTCLSDSWNEQCQ